MKISTSLKRLALAFAISIFLFNLPVAADPVELPVFHIAFDKSVFSAPYFAEINR